MSHDVADRDAAEQRLRDSLAHQLHVVIRHKSPPARLDAGQLLDRAIGVLDELARAARITSRVWSEALHAALEPTSRPDRRSNS